MPGIPWTIVNWNIGGAKYLELPTGPKKTQFRNRLNSALKSVIERAGNGIHRPGVLTLQEFVQYSPTAKGDMESVVAPPEDYQLHFLPMITTDRHSHQGKWNKVRKLGKWGEEARFEQGNAILVRRDLRVFPIWSLPRAGLSHPTWMQMQGRKPGPQTAAAPEDVILQKGLYFGDRDTEPRAASVLHVVVSPGSPNSEPLDLFVINLHLTTLKLEREGIPDVDADAARQRLSQLETIFNGVISRYNKWRKQGYRIRDERRPEPPGETYKRANPLWVIAGDFNFTPTSQEYRWILDHNFVALVDDPNTHTKSKGLGMEPTLTVDYVFAGSLFDAFSPRRGKMAARKNYVVYDPQIAVSDHFPLIAGLPNTDP